jgi:hypothetical protein
MPRNFRLPKLTWPPRNAAATAQWLLVGLLACNLVAGWFVFSPPGGSPEQLEQDAVRLRGELLRKRAILERTKRNVAKVETGRGEGDTFMQTYFLTERTAYSNVLGELAQAAREAKVTAKEHAFATEPIEGSADLAMMSITGNYEASYPELMQFINRLDRAQRLVIIESLNATPQAGSAGKLNVNMKLDAFVREGMVSQ